MLQVKAPRGLVSLIQEICAARQIKLTRFSGDWILCLELGERVTYVMGYDFALNNAAAKMICRDKVATSQTLAHHGVPALRHELFLNPEQHNYKNVAGTWGAMLAFLEAHPQGVVCKPNEGSGGQGVTFIDNTHDLEAAAQRLFAKNRALCLSPYENILGEFRVAMVEGEVIFVYEKGRPTLYGNGVSTVRELILAQLAGAPDFAASLKSLQEGAARLTDSAAVPAIGEEIVLNWKHNLGQGSVPRILQPADPAYGEITALALRGTRALNIALASVDIILTETGWKILEINSGIMTESLIKAHPHGEAMALDLYDRIVCECLGIERS